MFTFLKVPIFVVIFAILFANLYEYFIEDNSMATGESFARMSEDFEDKKSKFLEQPKMAFVVGGTGEVGKELVKALVNTRIFSKVVLIGRRQVNYEDEAYKNLEQRVIDFDNLDKHVDDFKGFDVGYSCLGTTRGKAGADGFYKVDHDYVVNTAKLALDGGCKQFHLVTAVGSNPNSMFLYPKTKGQVEEEIKAMNFESLYIYRPNLLLCDREEKRTGEKAFSVLVKPITYMFPTLISVPTSTVAMAMVQRTINATGGNFVETLDNKELHRAAGAAVNAK